MMNKDLLSKRARLKRRQTRARAKMQGTATQPRLSVQRSLQHIHCQLIDDVAGRTLGSTSDLAIKATGKKADKAKAVGLAIAEIAKKQGITSVIFNRSGNAYHGRVKALADGAREGGLQF